MDPAANNHTVVATFAATPVRQVRIVVAGETGWPAAQIGEVQPGSTALIS